MADHPNLTEREIEILQQVATGASNREIAQTLYISANTVKVHLRNIFEKLGVSSRTEATLYAIRAGLVAGVESDFIAPEPAWWQRRWVPAGGALAIGAVALLVGLLLRPGGPAPQTSVDLKALERERWQELAPMPTARKGLAVAAYDGKIYAIAGETQEGVTNVVERYDPATDTWETLPSKPTAVTDVQAAVIGGKIYVPGGRASDGEVSDGLEVFDPNHDTWLERSPLPEPLSRYSAVAYEGRMILFGGWNGEGFVAQVYEYDPPEDRWRSIGSLKGPIGDARAAISGNQIYLLGGFDGNQYTAYLELYNPNVGVDGAGQWESLEAMPIEKMTIEVAEIADVIYVVAGPEEKGYVQQYLTRSNQWRTSDEIGISPTIKQGVLSLGEYIYLFGGELEGEIIPNNYRYRAIYTIFLPISTNQ